MLSAIMTESSLRLTISLISEFVTFLWLALVFAVAVFVLLGRKIEVFKMPTFRSLNFGQKPRDESNETEEVGSGLLNRKIVVEKVKNVFGKTLKQKDKSEDEDFDIKKVIKLFQSHSNKKSVTFAEQDEVITVGSEILSEFETSTSFCEEVNDENEVEDEEIKNLLFHEVDENFKPEDIKSSSNYTNLGFWKNGSISSDVVTINVGKESPAPPSEPPPLPPRLGQKFSPKSRPSIPPPLPPKIICDSKPPLVRRDLKKSKSDADSSGMSVSELVENFIKLQESVALEPTFEGEVVAVVECESEPSEVKSDAPKPDDVNVFVFDEYRPTTSLCTVVGPPEYKETTTPTFTTFKPDLPVKSDWKEAFFQPVNKSLVSPTESKPKISKIPVPEQTKPKIVRSKLTPAKSSKIPKLVEEILEKSSEKKRESFNAATLKKCKINVSEMVSNFEQIQKDLGKSGKVPSGEATAKPCDAFSEGNLSAGIEGPSDTANSCGEVSVGNSRLSETEAETETETDGCTDPSNAESQDKSEIEVIILQFRVRDITYQI